GRRTARPPARGGVADRLIRVSVPPFVRTHVLGSAGVGQLSFWSADARPRALGDLEGLLCGPGRAELFGRGSLARLIVVLGPPPEPEPEPEPEEDEDAGADVEQEAEHD